LQERYVGGYASPNLIRVKKSEDPRARTSRRVDSIRGYAIYVTDKRLFGMRTGGQAKAFVSEFAFGILSPVRGKREATKPIRELENERDVEVHAQDVTAIRIKAPSTVGQLFLAPTGHMKIETEAGEVLQLLSTYNRDIEELRKLMEAFKPEALRID